MINNVAITGRLTKDVELRYTPNGVAVASFTVAVQRPFANQNGEREADFIQCVAWKGIAETMANYTQKGTLIGLEGRLQSRTYEGQEGKTVFVTELLVERFHFLEAKTEGGKADPAK